MEPYIDIHSHILPGLDDGAEDFEMSVRMLRQAALEGIGSIILSPHYKPMRRNPSRGTLKSIFEGIKERAAKEGLPLELYLGNEIYYSSEIVSAIREGRALTMAGSPYVLIEFSPMEGFAYIRDAVYSLLAEGYHPVLAHVERYACLMDKKIWVEELLSMGCHLQVNASSIIGKNGRGSRQDAKWLLKRRFVHFVGTDAHDDRGRSPMLREAAAYVSRRYGEEYCRQVFYANAEKILVGEL